MIEPEKWAQMLNAKLADAGAGGEATASATELEFGVTIAEIATAMLHENTFEQSETSGQANAKLMRVVFNEAPKDPIALLEAAEGIEHYAEKQNLPLPIYASSTPSGRLVANVCAFSSFDETSDAIECLLKITQKTPLELTQEATE